MLRCLQRCADLDIIRTGLEQRATTVSCGMHARRSPAVRGSVQGSIDGEKRSNIIGECRMSRAVRRMNGCGGVITWSERLST